MPRLGLIRLVSEQVQDRAPVDQEAQPLACRPLRILEQRPQVPLKGLRHNCRRDVVQSRANRSLRALGFSTAVHRPRPHHRSQELLVDLRQIPAPVYQHPIPRLCY